MSALRKLVIVQDDPFDLPRVVDRVLEAFPGSVTGVLIQKVRIGRRGTFASARELLKLWGPRHFARTALRVAAWKLRALVVNGALGRRERCFSVAEAARKHGVPVHRFPNVNDEASLRVLRETGVELVVSISGTQIYGEALRAIPSRGILNCHGGLLPRYRGLMPSFWTLARGETEGGVTVHFVDEKLDNGPIVVQRRYPILAEDTLRSVVTKSKLIAAEAIVEAVRLVEAGDPPLLPNDAALATSFSLPGPEDVRAFRARGRRFA